MTSELRLVQEIEKHECLYNSNLPEYNRKDLTDEAWGRVSYATNLTMTECKEKWRNIRSSLLRSLKPSEKTKKPYYLSSYLTFVLPFMKPLNTLELREDIFPLCASIGSGSKDSEVYICAVKSEEDAQNIFNDSINDAQDTEDQSDPLRQLNSSATRKRKRNNNSTSTRKTKTEEPAPAQQILEQEPPRTNLESMHYFLMSLIPEFETMSEEQTRLFKIKVMMLLDDIKSNYDKVKQSMSSSTESDRLSKRLINLLVRNLEKQT
ncbi:uncharacterized protein LOC123868098 [Maniola jurtina]|uniref:uncharacterized protein LOC123868098 n=1 Tax=Maniola jurtina TaxID=191418 RepID=UPI001E688A57|nr:uncharacterized protein LOC123868098 [Maniola jurtina]XP_045766422.1 uncharacterized protein LOC123868098 [Maniola jurtina]